MHASWRVPVLTLAAELLRLQEADQWLCRAEAGANRGRLGRDLQAHIGFARVEQRQLGLLLRMHLQATEAANDPAPAAA